MTAELVDRWPESSENASAMSFQELNSLRSVASYLQQLSQQDLQKHPLPGQAVFQGGKIDAISHRRHVKKLQEGDSGGRCITRSGRCKSVVVYAPDRDELRQVNFLGELWTSRG